VTSPAVASIVSTVAAPAPRQPSRAGTKPITLHLNEETRRQLKALAGEQGRTVESIGAEAFNLLFARYRKPEVATVKGRQGDWLPCMQGCQYTSRQGG
jgi:hypothetical protein